MEKTILFADDDKSIREVTKEILGIYLPKDYKIEEFPDGTSLKSRLERDVKDVRLVITDNTMPGISGSEIIKEYALKHDFPFILLYGGAEDIGKEAIENGAHSYIRKPCRYSELAEIIKEILKD